VLPDSSTSQDPANKRNFSKVSSKSKFGRNEKSNKRFAGNIDKSDMDFEDKICDDSLSCENAGSSNS
jgi:hypothetical protein|tara:strand:- start:313 stop:513 length:201 start_codon:yes stop_codon:yes gene_type:complete